MSTNNPNALHQVTGPDQQPGRFQVRSTNALVQTFKDLRLVHRFQLNASTPPNHQPVENRIILFAHRCIAFPFKFIWGIFNPTEYQPQPAALTLREVKMQELSLSIRERDNAQRSIEDSTARRDVCNVRIIRLIQEVEAMDEESKGQP